MSKEFVWTDDLVKHAVKVLGAAYTNPNLYNDGKWEGIGKELDNFKASHSTEDKREWEVLELKCNNGKISTFDDTNNSIYKGDRMSWVSTFIQRGIGWNIYKVRRLVDNEIFTVGEKISNNAAGFYTEETIKSFEIDSNNMMVNMVEDGGFYWLKDISKLPQRAKLFDCEDGSVIYEGDTFFLVQKRTFKVLTSCRHKPDKPDQWHFFTTYEKAMEYVLMNKPLLSLSDIFNADMNWGTTDKVIVYKDRLKELAKSKL